MHRTVGLLSLGLGLGMGAVLLEDQARERIRAAEEEAERIVAKAQTRAGQLRD